MNSLKLRGHILAGLLLAAPAWGQLILFHEFTGLNQPVPDQGEVVNLQTLTMGVSSILDLNITLNLSQGTDRAYNGDYYVSIGHGEAYAVLLNRAGRTEANPFGYADNGFAVRFDDSAANGDVHNYRLEFSGDSLAPLEGPLMGAWAPDARNAPPATMLDTTERTANLGAFNGLDPNGQWRFFIADLMAGGDGQLDSWGLEIRANPPVDQELVLGGARLDPTSMGQRLDNAVQLVGNLLYGSAHDFTLAGHIRGDGAIVHTGGGRLCLDGPNSFSGGVDVHSGALALGHDDALGSGSLRVHGGAIEGAGGLRRLPNPVSLDGDTAFSGSAGLIFRELATLTGTRVLTVHNNTTLEGGIGQSGGSFGLIKEGDGALVLGGQSSYSGPTTVNAGWLWVMGQVPASPFSVNNGGRLGGSGSIGSVNVNDGGQLSPGTSPGTLNTGPETWNGGGVYVWEINQAQGSQGADPGWDWLNINGGLTIAATPENKFKIQITSLTLDNQAGPVADFNNQHVYTWTIATASSEISGFDPAVFNLDTSQFLNEIGASHFDLSQAGNNLALNFVPEPGAWTWASSLSLLLLAMARRMRRRKGAFHESWER